MDSEDDKDIEYLQRCPPDIWTWIKSQLAQTGQEGEPEVDMLILVAELHGLCPILSCSTAVKCSKA